MAPHVIDVTLEPGNYTTPGDVTLLTEPATSRSYPQGGRSSLTPQMLSDQQGGKNGKHSFATLKETS